jgi:hypothetical protein
MLSVVLLSVINVGCVNYKPIMLNFIMLGVIILSVVNTECHYTLKPSIPKRSDLDCSTRCLSSDNCTAYNFNKNPLGTDAKKRFFAVDAKNKLECLSLVNNLGREY